MNQVYLVAPGWTLEMLAVSSPVRCADVEDCRGGAGMEMEEIGPMSDLDFDFTVDDIDFRDFFLRLEDGDALPELEVDPGEIFTEFEAIATGSDGVMDQEVPSVQPLADVVHLDAVDPCSSVLGEENTTRIDVEEGKGEYCNRAEEEVAGNNGDFGGGGGGTVVLAEKSPSSTTSSSQEAESRHKSTSKHSQGKKKAKVDWTPELHRRFVQAVEQLGIDKAVPSRVLEIMGIDSLTRHNTASHLQSKQNVTTKPHVAGSRRDRRSHRRAGPPSRKHLVDRYMAAGHDGPIAALRTSISIRGMVAWPMRFVDSPAMDGRMALLRRQQMQAEKYRSHRKHMLAREVEAASWTQRRQMYAAGGAPAAAKRPDYSNAWTVPTIGFPPPPPPPHHPMQHFGTPLHVWGHPTPGVETPSLPMWPRHLVPRAPTPPWAPPPPSDPAFWHHPYMRGPAHMPGQVAPCVAVPMPAARFPAPQVRSVLPCPPPMYRPLVPPALGSKSQQHTQLQLQIQPSSESIDAAIGDVLSKPWLPLPLGLKPPSVHSVMGELQRQGVADVPPACG